MKKFNNKLSLITLISVISSNIINTLNAAAAGYNPTPYSQYNWQQARQNTVNTLTDTAAVVGSNGMNIAADRDLYNQIRTNANTKMGQQAIKDATSSQARKIAYDAAKGIYNGYTGGNINSGGSTTY